MTELPLVSYSDPSRVFAWRKGKPVRLSDFLADVQRVAAAMPDTMHMLNLCHDRYHFTVAFAAAAISNRITLLPSTRTADTTRQIRAFAPDVFCLSEQPCDLNFPQILYPGEIGSGAQFEAQTVPMIAADRVVVYAFTSGSTGTPVPHPKNWGALTACVQSGSTRLGLNDDRRYTLIGTVPPQHMYGFESTVLLALQGGAALGAAHPFYPADVASDLAAVPAPRVFVTTPVHLSALLSSQVALPPVALILSATAPLSRSLAHEAEVRIGAPLLEIYGSTETGQIATRRTAETATWELLPGVHLQRDHLGVGQAVGGHLAQTTALHDVIEPLDSNHFLLHGRSADMVNIAGNRSSLAYLDHKLNSIPGVIDGVFYMPDDMQSSHNMRLMAFVVAPTLTHDHLLAALRERVDAVFLPRPLVLVDALPRNTTGKLPRSTLHELAKQHSACHEVADDRR
ncbi:MAG: AMP-binding protein [Gammaproteobacteria bacterium]